MTKSMRLSPAGVLIESLRRFKKDFFSPYRPELHYMRGPGPRWGEKHALLLAVTASAARAAQQRPHA